MANGGAALACNPIVDEKAARIATSAPAPSDPGSGTVSPPRTPSPSDQRPARDQQAGRPHTPSIGTTSDAIIGTFNDGQQASFSKKRDVWHLRPEVV